jgi:predicted phosphodiesterase
MTRIFIASDIQWSWSPGLPPASRYHELVLEEKPDYVFLLGDIIADGSDHRDNSTQLMRMAAMLGKQTYLLFGNNDYEFPAAMRRVKERATLSPDIHIIERGIFTIDGIKCLALDYRQTKSIANLKRIHKEMESAKEGGIDIIFAHVPNRRKPWLLLHRPKMIITGHFGPGIMDVRGTRIVSSDHFPYNYYVIDIKSIARNSMRVREVARLRSRTYESLKARMGKAFGLLLDAHERYMRFPSKERKEAFVKQLTMQGVPRQLASEFLPSPPRKSMTYAKVEDHPKDDFVQHARTTAQAYRRARGKG